MKNKLVAPLLLLSTQVNFAQKTQNEWENPSVFERNKEAGRSTSLEIQKCYLENKF